MLLDDHEREPDKFAPLRTTSCPIRMLKGDREWESEEKCVQEGDREGDGIPLREMLMHAKFPRYFNQRYE